MTLPVPVFPQASLLSTRRILGRRFHLRPDPVTNRLIAYSLAYAAIQHSIQLYAHCSLSNHQHTSFFDEEGRHPEFRRDFHSLVTRSVNLHRGTSEAKWSPDRKSPVVLYDTETVLDHNAYIVANACRHDLVETPEEWPGLISTVDQLCAEPRIIRKPKRFYDPDGTLPKFVELRFVKPPMLADWSDDEYRGEIARRVLEKCETARRRRREAGRRVVGRLTILAESPESAPGLPATQGKRNPLVACKNLKLRIALLLWLKWFRKEHRRARQQYEGGLTGVEFPVGTYWHVLRYGVNCSTAGPPGALA